MHKQSATRTQALGNRSLPKTDSIVHPLGLDFVVRASLVVHAEDLAACTDPALPFHTFVADPSPWHRNLQHSSPAALRPARTAVDRRCHQSCFDDAALASVVVAFAVDEEMRWDVDLQA